MLRNGTLDPVHEDSAAAGRSDSETGQAMVILALTQAHTCEYGAFHLFAIFPAKIFTKAFASFPIMPSHDMTKGVKSHLFS